MPFPADHQGDVRTASVPTPADYEDDDMAKGSKKASRADKPRRYRDAATGRFVTKKYAKKHPKKTLRAW